MADMQIAVGLGRKAGDHGIDAARRQILGDDVADEIPAAVPARGLSPAHGAALLSLLPTFCCMV